MALNNLGEASLTDLTLKIFKLLVATIHVLTLKILTNI